MPTEWIEIIQIFNRDRLNRVNGLDMEDVLRSESPMPRQSRQRSQTRRNHMSSKSFDEFNTEQYDNIKNTPFSKDL